MGENKFEWTDEKVKEFLSQIFEKDKEKLTYFNEAVNYFKQSKTIPLDYGVLTCLSAANKVHYYNPSACLGADKRVELCTAHSVKRLSDNQIFTINDEVTATIGNTTKPSGKIKEFTIDNGILLVHTEKDICDINWLGKVENRELLFVSEDGVNIYAGDKWWSVWVEDCRGWRKWDVSESDSSKQHSYNPSAPVKRFSSNDAANNYVAMNHECLSVNDIANLFGNRSFAGTEYTLNQLKQLAQSKIDSK